VSKQAPATNKNKGKRGRRANAKEKTTKRTKRKPL
jgi:hypothetical protein